MFRYLNENSAQFITADDILVPLSFEDYNWNIHSLLTNENKAESMLYKQSWRFVMLIEAMKAYKAWFDAKGKPAPKRIGTATKLLEKLFDSPIPSIYQIVGRKLLTLSGVKLPSGGFELEDGGIDSINVGAGEITFDQVKGDKDLRQHLSENIENLINYLDRALSDADSTWPTVYLISNLPQPSSSCEPVAS